MQFDSREFNDLRSWRKRGIGLTLPQMRARYKLSTYCMSEAENGRVSNRKGITLSRLYAAYGLTKEEFERMLKHQPYKGGVGDAHSGLQHSGAVQAGSAQGNTGRSGQA